MSLETTPSDTSPSDDGTEELFTSDTPPSDDVPDAELPPVLTAKCTACRVAVQYRPTSSGNGFTTVAVLGMAADTLPHLGANGLPACPKCNGSMTAADLAPAGEAIAAAAATLAEQERELPFPFNYAAAMDSIVDKNRDVQMLRDRHDNLKKQTANAKRDLDEAEAALGVLITKLDERRHGVPDDTTERPALLTMAEQTPTPAPEVTLADLVLRASGRFITAEMISAWTYEQREDARAWCERAIEAEAERIKRGVDPIPLDQLQVPAVFGTAHQAGELPQETRNPQHCRVCGAVVATPTRDADGNDTTTYYSPGALVGTDCPGEAEIAAEPVRTLPKRHRRQKSAKADARRR